jgi:MFS family permease
MRLTKTNSHTSVRPLLVSADFRRFWVGQTLSSLGSGIARVALILFVQSRYGSGAAVGVLLFAETVPRLLGPLLGAVADRLDRRRLMIGCDCAQALLFAAVALQPPFLAILALVAIASTAQTLFVPARLALLPSLVEKEMLPQGNSLMGIAFNFQVALGPIVGAVLFAAFGLSTALLVNTASFIASALLLGAVRNVAPTRPTIGLGARVGDGIRFVRREPRLSALVTSLLLSVGFLALDDVALVFLVRGELDASSAAFGLVATAFGVGMVAASSALVMVRGGSAGRLYLLALCASGIGTALTGLAPTVALVLVAQAIAGAGNGVDNIASETLIQQEVPDQLLGRVFGVATTAANLGAGIAAIAGGFLLEVTSARTVFVVGGTGVLLVALAMAGPLRRGSGTSAASVPGA